MSTLLNHTDPSLENMVGQMLIAGFKGSSPHELNPILTHIRDDFLGGVILYDQDISGDFPAPHNIRSVNQVKILTDILQEAAASPLFIALDQEGGQVNRLKEIYGFPSVHSWKKVGEINDLKYTRNFSRKIAQTLRSAGFNFNFAPVMDLEFSSKTYLSIKNRCLSAELQTVTEHSREFILGHREYHILTACKHFPGQGSAKADTHSGFADVSEDWTEVEIDPYKQLIEQNAVDSIMASHIFNRNLDEKYPATLSKLILFNLLRKKLGYEGVIISDDPQMRAIMDYYDLKSALKLMLLAGIDIFCFGNNLIFKPNLIEIVIQNILELVTSGEVPEIRIIESFKRIQKLKALLN